MQKKQLGNTDIMVSKICLGTMTWGEQNTEKQAHEQLDYAIKEREINFIDTAEMYPIAPKAETQGLTETYIGTWLAKNSELRKDIILASKFVGPGIEWIRKGKGLVSEDMETALDASLERLQTSYVDLYQLHWPQRQVNKMGKMNWEESMLTSKQQEEQHILEILQTFDTLQKSGKVRFFGLSNETPWGTMKFLEIARKHNLPEIQSVQNPYSIMNRQYEVGMAEISMYEGIACLPYSPLAGGVLSGKYKDGKLPEGSRYALWGRARQPQNLNARALTFVDDLGKIAKRENITLAQMSLAWVSDRSFVHSNIIGATNLEQLKEDIDSAEITLSSEVRKEIDDICAQSPNPATF